MGGQLLHSLQQAGSLSILPPLNSSLQLVCRAPKSVLEKPV